MVGLKNTFGKALRLTALAASLGAVAACDHVRQHSVSQKHGDFTVLEGDAEDHLSFVGRRGGVEPVVCLAPSPDAISADSKSTSFGLGTGNFSGNGALAAAQAAAYVGMRTQTIQLLRDGYYRLCEAYMNQAMTKEQYNLALVSMPRVFSLLMTIDAVAGAAVAPPVAIQAAVPGTTQETSFGLTPGTDGAVSVNSGGNSSVAASPAVVEIANQSRGPAINEHGAAVLTATLQQIGGDTMAFFCASILASNETSENELKPLCVYHLRKYFDGSTPSETVKKLRASMALDAAGKATAKAEAAKAKAEAENKKLKEKVAALSKKVAANDKTRAEFSEGLAKEAVKGGKRG